MSVPANPAIYHITHVSNLPSILASGGLLSDAAMIAKGGPSATIGMSSIKKRRLTLPVHVHAGLMVGECVPFYFCPRSVMLYILHRGNHPEVSYKGGQDPIIHLRADLTQVIRWASTNVRWAFSLSNAGAAYCTFRKDVGRLHEIDWASVANNDFRDATVKEGKQAEFLVDNFFPFGLVDRIGVYNAAMRSQVAALLTNSSHQPPVSVERSWYY